MIVKRLLAVCAVVVTAFSFVPASSAEALKPYILAHTPPGNLQQVAQKTEAALKQHGFQIVGTYSPFPGAVVICATNDALKAAAVKPKYGGFGAAQRVAVTESKSGIQVSYVNPTYLGVAYGLGRLDNVRGTLEKALGAVKTFGSENGIEESKLGPGQYHYGPFMPYFNNVDYFTEKESYQAAVALVEEKLAKNAGGTKRVYRIDIPGKEETVFGVAIDKGDGPDSGKKDTDKEIIDIVDHKELRHTAYLPYEIMVTGSRIISLAARYRIALHFPDTPMMGDHGFTKIMSAPAGIMTALEKLAGLDRF